MTSSAVVVSVLPQPASARLEPRRSQRFLRCLAVAVLSCLLVLLTALALPRSAQSQGPLESVYYLVEGAMRWTFTSIGGVPQSILDCVETLDECYEDVHAALSNCADAPGPCWARLKAAVVDLGTSRIPAAIVRRLRDAALQLKDHAFVLADQLRSPGYCFTCQLLHLIIHSAHIAGEAFYSTVALPLVSLMLAGFLLVQLIRVGRHFVGVGGQAGAAPVRWSDHTEAVAWLLLALLLLGGFGVVAPEKVFGQIVSGLLSPLLNFSTAVATTLLGDTLAFSGTTTGIQAFPQLVSEVERITDINTTVLLAQSGSVSSADRQLLSGLMRLVLYIQTVSIVIFGRALTYMTHIDGLGLLMAIVSIAVGISLLVPAVVFYLIAAFRLMDALFRVVLVVILLPVLIACLPFAVLRQGTFWPATRAVAYGCAYFLVAGVFFAVIVQIIMLSFAISVGGSPDLNGLLLFYGSSTGSSLDPDYSTTRVLPLSSDGSAGLSDQPDLSGFLTVLVALLVSIRMLSVISDVASGLARYHQKGGKDVSDPAVRRIPGAS